MNRYAPVGVVLLGPSVQNAWEMMGKLSGDAALAGEE